MKPFPCGRTLAALSCLAPLAVPAQTTSIPRLESVIVTPGRQIQPADAALGDVTVIGRDELARAGQDSLAQILARHPAIGMYDSGGPQTSTGVFLRGANANQTLVLLDGLRINGSTAGAVNWNALDPALIERVEIVRGAASSLYGSDAIGGVINIITRKSSAERPLSAFGAIGMGSHGTFKSSAGASGARDGWDYALSASMADSDGFSATNPLAQFGAYHPDKDGYTQHTLSGALGYTWKPGHHVGLTAYNGYINGDYDNGEFAHPSYAITRQQAYSLTSTDAVTDDWESVLRLGFTKELGDDRGGFSSTYGSLQRSYSWQNNLKLGRDHRLSLVLERLEERALGSTVYTDERRDTNAAGLIYRGDMGAHHLQASVRNDNISGYGNQATGGLTYEYDIDARWRVSLAGNTGFKAPTFNDLYAPVSWGANPDLRPEKSRNVEAGLRYASEQTELGVTVYQNKIRNLIISDSNYVLQNLQSATIRGVTLTGARQWGDTTLRASADFMNPRNDSSGNQLNRRARQVYRFGAEHRIRQWTLGAEYLFTGKRYDDTANTIRLGGYGLLNLAAGYDFSHGVSARLQWNNVLDKDYANAYGYNMPGSNVFLNLAWRM